MHMIDKPGTDAIDTPDTIVATATAAGKSAIGMQSILNSDVIKLIEII